MSKSWDPMAARARPSELVRERAYRDGLDIVLASGNRSSFYMDGKRVTLHPEGLHLTGRLMLARKAHGTGGLIEGELGAEPEAVLALVAREDGDADQFRAEFRVRSLISMADLRGADHG